jgi:proteasome accessory factor A
MTAVQLQRELCDQAHKHVEDRWGSDADADTVEVLDRWSQVLDDLADDPSRLAGQLDWVAKQQILEGYRSRDGLDWSDARLHLVDLQYSDVRRDKGLYHRLVAAGRMERVLTDIEIDSAVHQAPDDTRAWFRGECVRRYGAQVAAASWDSVIFDIPGRASLQRVPMLEPLRGTRAHVGALLDQCTTAAELVDTLTGH